MEAAARRDPTKKLAAVPGANQKAEKAAIEGQLAKERQIRSDHANVIAKLVWFTLFLRAINESASLIPPVIQFDGQQSIGHLFNLMGVDCYKRCMGQLLYQITKCLGSPLSQRGPLLASAYFKAIQESSLIDSNWIVPGSLGIYESLVNHLMLTGDSMFARESSFAIAFPVITKVISAVLSLGSDDGSILRKYTEVVHANAKYIPADCLGMLFQLFAQVLSRYPSLLSLVQNTSESIAASLNTRGNFPFPWTQITGSLKSASEFERKFALFWVSLAPQNAVPKDVKLWIAVLVHDPICQAIAQTLIAEGESKADLKDVLEISLNADYDAVVSSSAVKCFLSLLDDQECVFELLSGQYKQLFSKRLPEVASVRAPNMDLTAKERQKWSLLIQSLAETLNSSQGNQLKRIPKFIEFFFAEAYFDAQETVSETLLNASGVFVSAILEDSILVDQVAAICDRFLSSPSAGPKGTSADAADRVRIYAVILLAKLSDRFPADDPRRTSLLASLFATLSTPSEGVQMAVADAMIPLFVCVNDALSHEYQQKLLQSVTGGKSLAIRRGAAYGMGAFVKGRSTKTLRDLLPQLTAILSADNKNTSLEAKQGALFALELIARYLGRLFEPYIVKLLDVLIGTFADGRIEIREATVDAAQTMMSSVTTLGARLLLPILLNLLDSSAWRSKVGAIEWLGAMANLSPKILAKQLHGILPRLVNALTDSHHQVQRAAREALNRYGTVVRNPEIKSLSSLILEALANPPQYTDRCLTALLRTAFSHIIDGPSLALVEPVLTRALCDRGTGGTEVKRKAAQIIGNLATDLVDPRDLETVLGTIVPALVDCLSDPVPEVRANCGKVLGILVRTVGEKTPMMASLADRLLDIVGSTVATSVDRAGAAQALAEIMAARGPTNCGPLISRTIMPALSNPRSGVREGFVMLVGFLPPAFDAYNTLAEFYMVGDMRKLIGSSLGLLADDSEAVREAANKACHTVIASVARIDHVAIFDLLMDNLSDSRWRCRLGCLQLFQEFLSKFSAGESDAVMGIYSMPTTQELAEGGIDEERVRLLMSKAFLFRFDLSSSAIRHLALTIWKGLASHPLRAITMILPSLLEECIDLVDGIQDGKEVVYKALEDILFKLGDRLLVPLLQQAKDQIAKINDDESESEDEDLAAVVFISAVAAKLLGAASFPDVSGSFLENSISLFIDILQEALSSPDESVRGQATRLFSYLIESGNRLNQRDLVNRIVDPILEELVSDPTVDPITLDGLLALLEADETVLQVTIERILTAVKDNHSDCENEESLELLGAICEVTAAVFETVSAEGASRAVPVLRALLRFGRLQKLDEAIRDRVLIALLAAIEADEDSPYQVSLSQLFETLYGESSTIALAFLLIRLYCRIEDASLGRFYDIWPDRILRHLNTDSLEEAKLCMMTLLETVSAEHLLTLTESLNSSLTRPEATMTKPVAIVLNAANAKEPVTGMVKALIVPLLTSSATLQSDEEERRTAACRLSEHLLQMLPAAAWGSALTNLVGALIRTAADKRTTSSLVFETLSLAVIRQTNLVKPFHPQLQRIFANALAVDGLVDTASQALVALLPCLSRPEALLGEWMTVLTAAASETSPLRQSILSILTRSKMTNGLEVDACIEAAKASMADVDGDVRKEAAEWISFLVTLGDFAPSASMLSSLLKLQ